MTKPPPPASPCIRVHLDYVNADTSLAGSRFYLSYGGSAPNGGNCQTLASDIATAWGAHLAGLVATTWTLNEVDVLDIATDLGASGQAHPSIPGTLAGTALPSQCAINVEYDIARRYRGGKPRMFLPSPTDAQILDSAHYLPAFITNVNAGMQAFMAAVTASVVGTVGPFAHVSLSYYQDFKNLPNSSGRMRAVPQYRDAALVDQVNNYACKGVIGSQRRRRTATTP